ncbi:MAG: zinc ABC transporter substrate-binding protein [Deinococcales bacterium]
MCLRLAREPSIQRMAELLSLIQEKKVKAIFAEKQLSSRPAEIIAAEAHIALAVLDPVGGDAETSSYADLLKFNARIIREALE